MVKEFHFEHFSTGELLRNEVKTGSDLGKEIDSYISKGNLVPGKVAVNLIKNRVIGGPVDNIYVIDGYPRN